MRSIAIVSTQMQLLNCVEVINEYEYKKNDLIVYASSKRRYNQIYLLLEQYNYKEYFNNIYNLYRSIDTGYIAYIKNILLVQKITKKNLYDLVIISNYKDSIHRYLQYRVYEKNKNCDSVLVDDGMAILNMVKGREEELKNHTPQYLYSGRLERNIYKLFYRFRKYVPSRIIYYTAYSDLNISKYDVLKLNQYLFLKQNKLINNTSIDGSKNVYIIGQPLVQLGIIDKNVYSGCIENFIAIHNLKEDECVYIPHPVENEANSLSDCLRKNILICRYDIPFEIIALSLSKDSIVVGFYTSVLVNIKKMGCKCDVYSLKIKKNDYKVLDLIATIDNLYKNFEKEDIKVL